MRDRLKLSLRSHLRYDYLDFEVNGTPLLQQISIDLLYGTQPSDHRKRGVKSNLVSTLRLKTGLYPETAAALSLLSEPGRAPIFGCSECCDDCEAITVSIQRSGGAVVWQDFRFIPAADVREAFGTIPEPKWATLLRAGPFWFEEREYMRAVAAAMEHLSPPASKAVPGPGAFGSTLASAGTPVVRPDRDHL